MQKCALCEWFIRRQLTRFWSIFCCPYLLICILYECPLKQKDIAYLLCDAWPCVFLTVVERGTNTYLKWAIQGQIICSLIWWLSQMQLEETLLLSSPLPLLILICQLLLTLGLISVMVAFPFQQLEISIVFQFSHAHGWSYINFGFSNVHKSMHKCLQNSVQMLIIGMSIWTWKTWAWKKKKIDI